MTRVVTMGELARPVGRLREQMEKLQLHSSQVLSRSEGKVVMLEQQLAMADPSVRRLEREKQAAETRAEIRAERRVSGTGRGWRERNRSELTKELVNVFSLPNLLHIHSTDC